MRPTCALDGCVRTAKYSKYCGVHAGRLWRARQPPGAVREKLRLYRRTLMGYLHHSYSRMTSRIKGVNAHSAKYPHLWMGKDLLNKAVFIEWASTNPDYLRLHTEWEKAEYDKKLSPSVDRIDSSKGYSLENMRWVTKIENCLAGNRARHAKSAAKAGV